MNMRPASPLRILHGLKEREERRAIEFKKLRERSTQEVEQSQFELSKSRRRSEKRTDVSSSIPKITKKNSLPAVEPKTEPVIEVRNPSKGKKKNLSLLKSIVMTEKDPVLKKMEEAKAGKKFHETFKLLKLNNVYQDLAGRERAKENSFLQSYEKGIFPKVGLEDIRRSLEANSFPLIDDTLLNELNLPANQIFDVKYHMLAQHANKPDLSQLPIDDFKKILSKKPKISYERSDANELGKWYVERLEQLTKQTNYTFRAASTLFSFVFREMIKMCATECQEKGQLLLTLYYHSLALFETQTSYAQSVVNPQHLDKYSQKLKDKVKPLKLLKLQEPAVDVVVEPVNTKPILPHEGIAFLEKVYFEFGEDVLSEDATDNDSKNTIGLSPHLNPRTLSIHSPGAKGNQIKTVSRNRAISMIGPVSPSRLANNIIAFPERDRSQEEDSNDKLRSKHDEDIELSKG